MNARKTELIGRARKRARLALERRLKVGDYVREVDGTAVGTVVHIMRDAGLVVVNWPPSRQGVAYHPDDLVKVE